MEVNGWVNIEETETIRKWLRRLLFPTLPFTLQFAPKYSFRIREIHLTKLDKYYRDNQEMAAWTSEIHGPSEEICFEAPHFFQFFKYLGNTYSFLIWMFESYYLPSRLNGGWSIFFLSLFHICFYFCFYFIFFSFLFFLIWILESSYIVCCRDQMVAEAATMESF